MRIVEERSISLSTEAFNDATSKLATALGQEEVTRADLSKSFVSLLELLPGMSIPDKDSITVTDQGPAQFNAVLYEDPRGYGKLTAHIHLHDPNVQLFGPDGPEPRVSQFSSPDADLPSKKERSFDSVSITLHHETERYETRYRVSFSPTGLLENGSVELYERIDPITLKGSNEACIHFDNTGNITQLGDIFRAYTNVGEKVPLDAIIALISSTRDFSKPLAIEDAIDKQKARRFRNMDLIRDLDTYNKLFTFAESLFTRGATDALNPIDIQQLQSFFSTFPGIQLDKLMRERVRDSVVIAVSPNLLTADLSTAEGSRSGIRFVPRKQFSNLEQKNEYAHCTFFQEGTDQGIYITLKMTSTGGCAGGYIEKGPGDGGRVPAFEIEFDASGVVFGVGKSSQELIARGSVLDIGAIIHSLISSTSDGKKLEFNTLLQ